MVTMETTQTSLKCLPTLSTYRPCLPPFQANGLEIHPRIPPLARLQSGTTVFQTPRKQ